MLNVSKPTNQPEKPNRQLIAECAYSIWEKEGRSNGRDLAHWLQAEAQLSSCCCSTGTTASKAVTPVQQPRTGTKQTTLVQTTLTPGAARQGTTVTGGQRN